MYIFHCMLPLLDGLVWWKFSRPFLFLFRLFFHARVEIFCFHLFPLSSKTSVAGCVVFRCLLTRQVESFSQAFGGEGDGKTDIHMNIKFAVLLPLLVKYGRDRWVWVCILTQTVWDLFFYTFPNANQGCLSQTDGSMWIHRKYLELKIKN